MQTAANGNAWRFPGLLNPNEIRSVTAVVAYVAYTHKIAEETVLSILTSAFGVTAVKDIPSANYDEAIRFLVDFHFDGALN